MNTLEGKLLSLGSFLCNSLSFKILVSLVLAALVPLSTNFYLLKSVTLLLAPQHIFC